MRTIAAAVAAALALLATPASAAGESVVARDLGYVCDGSTTVHSVRLANHTGGAKRFVVTTELVTSDGRSYSELTRWVPADSTRTITFRSSPERRRAWAVNIPSTGGLLFNMDTSLCG